jgi:hypothetical protein
VCSTGILELSGLQPEDQTSQEKCRRLHNRAVSTPLKGFPEAPARAKTARHILHALVVGREGSIKRITSLSAPVPTSVINQ